MPSWIMLVLFGEREFDGAEPVLAQDFHELDQTLELDRLGNEGIGPQRINRFNVGIRAGSGEYHDGDATQFAMFFYFAQDFTAIFARHVQVEEDQAWPWGVRICVLSAPQK